MPQSFVVPYSSGSYDSSSHPQVSQWSSIVGIVTAIVGNILISFALNTQRYAHIRIDREYREKQDPEAKKARRKLPKQLRNYGTAVQQEEVAEERQRINENAPIPEELHGDRQDESESRQNGKRHISDETVTADDTEDEGENEHTQRQSYLKSPWWWLGIIMMTIGETGNFLAYGFAPASIVSPLGVVGLISNCLIAPLMLKERFRQRDAWGVLISIGGAVTVVLSAKTNEKKLGPDALWADIKRWEFLAYVLVTVVAICVLMYASPKYGQRTILVDLGLVGLFGGYTALSTKGVASLLSTSLYRAFEYPILYVLVLILVLSAVMQLRYLNRGLQNFDSTQVIPVQFVMFTLSVIVGSAVLYRDFERTDVDHVIKFVLGCLLTFGGVYLITSGRKGEDDYHEDDDEQDGGQIRLLDEESVDESTTPIKQEPDLKLDTSLPAESDTQRPASAVPSISVTPAAESSEALNKKPWTTSAENLIDIPERPHTPRNQTLPDAGSSQTPFYTPRTSQRPVDRFNRTTSSPAQPETPVNRGISPPKPNTDATIVTPSSLHPRTSISRLLPSLPGPILQPLSSSLAGIVADRILKGEGSPSPNRLALRRHRSNREAFFARPRGLRLDTNNDLEAGPESAFGVQTATEQRDRTLETSPLLLRRGNTTVDEGYGLASSLKRTKGRLRSMSETLTHFMDGVTKRRGSREDDADTAADEEGATLERRVTNNR